MKKLNKKPRFIAISAFAALLNNKKPIEQFLSDCNEFTALSPTEQNFTRYLLDTGLKHKGQAAIAANLYIQKKIPEKLVEVTTLLELGVVELLFMNGDDYGVVDSYVTLCSGISPGHKGLVNAVLRRVAENRAELAGKFEISRNFPQWFREKVQYDYGKKVAATIFDSVYWPQYVDLSTKGNSALIAEQIGGNLLPERTIRLNNAHGITSLYGFDEGFWWVQDVAASIPVKLFNGGNKKLAIDLCAAPGGKTAQLAGIYEKVVAVEKNPERIKRLRQNLARLKIENVEIIEADALEWLPENKADAVLLDAPCTSSGLIRKSPDILYSKSIRDISEMKKLQKQLLNHATSMVSNGGQLVYGTCSIFKDEGENIISEILKENESLKLQPVLPAELSGIEEVINDTGCIRALPHNLKEYGGMDGFFTARFIL